MIHLGEQCNHVCMDHGRVQLNVERRVTETLLQAVPACVGTFAMHFAACNLSLIGHVVPEVVHVRASEPYFEGDDKDDRRDYSCPEV